MMKPDVKIVIAWSGTYQKQTAQMLYDKLTAYSKKGYPVNVSLINEELIKKNKRFLGKSEESIAERMESYFSDFDYAFFLFDTIGKACHLKDADSKECQKLPPLLSANLLYEYGLAYSSLINRPEEKRICCFSPSEIDPKSLRYIKGIALEQYDNFPCEYKKSKEKQTKYIIESYVHEEILMKHFNGLSEPLPPLKKEKNEYVVIGKLKIKDPMRLSNNTYWANLKELQPVAINNEQYEVGKLFKKEYKRFDDSIGNHPESEYLGRRLLYIVDRAVFIMYLREEDYWDNVIYNGYADPKNPRLQIKSLLEIRLDYLKSNNLDTENDYYVKAIEALHGVFLYQKCSRPKDKDKPLSGMLFKADNLDKIIKFLCPVTELGKDEKGNDLGNKMVFCLTADYLALAYHKKATKKLGEFIGETGEFYLDNINHMKSLHNALKDCKKENDIVKTVLQLFYDAAILFKKVVKYQEILQDKNHNFGYRYIWENYALYNQARCEFMIHLIDSIYKKETSQSITKFVNAHIIEAGRAWHENLIKSVNSRREDYVDFQKQPLFPQFITFNLQAEYYHASFEYELSCFIEKQLNPNSQIEEFTDYEKFQNWKKSNLTITDVLSVDGKVARLNKFKRENIFDDDLVPFINDVEKLVTDTNKKNTLIEWSESLKNAAISENNSEFEKVEKRGLSLKEIETEFGINIGVFVAKIKSKFGKS